VVWIHNVSASAGTSFELIGSTAVTRDDLIVAFVKESRLRPLGIYEVVTVRRYATTDNNAAVAIGTRATCQRVLELPVPRNEVLDRARRELKALANSTSQRDTRNLGIHDRLLAVLHTLYEDDVEVRTALENLLLPSHRRFSPPTVPNEAVQAQHPVPAVPAVDPDEAFTARRPVALDISNPSDRSMVELAIVSAPRLRVASPDESTPPLATLQLTGNALTIENAQGPIFPAVQFPEHLNATVRTLTDLACAQAIRELEGEHGINADDVDIEMGTVENGRPHQLPDHGSGLGLADRVYVKITSRSKRLLYAHVVNIGERSSVKTISDPGGVRVLPGGPSFVLGGRTAEDLQGVPLHWPFGLPTDQPRIDELIIFLTTKMVDLSSLSSDQIHRRGAHSGLRPIKNLLNGRAASRDFESNSAAAAVDNDGYLMKRLSFFLHPRSEALGGLGGFAIYDGGSAVDTGSTEVPEADARSLGVDGPSHLTVRIADFVVSQLPPEFGTRIRLDALICTRSIEVGGSYRTQTARFPSVKSGERLPLDRLLSFEALVRDFIDVSLFVSRDAEGSHPLALLLASRRGSPEFDEALRLLFYPNDVAGSPMPRSGPKISLNRLARQLLRDATGHSIGLFSGFFLSRDRFGIGRHPVEGLYRTPSFSFALVLDPGEPVAAV
jgi:hypothetical protein